VIEPRPPASTSPDGGSPDAGPAPGPKGEAPIPKPRPALPGPNVNPLRRKLRYVIARAVATLLVRCVLRLRVDGRERLPAGQYLMCFSHANWADPFILMACMPWRPRLYFFGPKEEDMTVGGRNHLMSWVGNAVPYRPGKNDLLDATRRVGAVFDAGGILAIAGEGRIHAHENEILPVSEGAAYFALRAGVPVVPVAINGTTWFTFRSRVRVRIGDPLVGGGRPTRDAVEALTEATHTALIDLVADFPERRPPGRLGRGLTELFNDWPEGGRPVD
jgi:1-acyl-sn-glycerol-3-phosphate acyltransferase